MWNPHILDLRVPVRNGLGLYRNGGQQYGGGKIVISKSSFAITLDRTSPRPDVVKPITRTEVKDEQTTYFSGSSRLVVFKSELDSDEMLQRQQIQYDTDWDVAVKLHMHRTLFLTTTEPSATERLAAEKQAAIRRQEAQQEKKEAVQRSIGEGHVFNQSEVVGCPRFMGRAEELAALYQLLRERRLTIPLVINEVGAVTVQERSQIKFDKARVQAIVAFAPGRLAVGRDTFTVKSATALIFEPTYTFPEETVKATFTVKKGRRFPTLQVTSDATPEVQAWVRGLLDFEGILVGRSDGEYQFQYLEQLVRVEIRAKGADNKSCESILLNSQEVPKPLFRYRRLEGYADWHRLE